MAKKTIITNCAATPIGKHLALFVSLCLPKKLIIKHIEDMIAEIDSRKGRDILQKVF